MLGKKELGEYLDSLGFRNMQQAETDYLQHAVLAGLYMDKDSDNLIFKGGTALQKIYGLNRFSIDLDFNVIDSEAIEKAVQTAKKYMKGIGISTESTSEKREGSVSYTLKIRGPIYESNNNEKSLATLRLDFSVRNDMAMPQEKNLITPAYDDLRPYYTSHMCKDEILSEKYRALISRSQARDLFDFDFLIKKEARLFYGAVEKKMSAYPKTKSNAENWGINALMEKAKVISSDWHNEINDIIYKTHEAMASPAYAKEALGRIRDYLDNNPSFSAYFGSSEGKPITTKSSANPIGRMCTFPEFEKRFHMGGNDRVLYTDGDYGLFAIVQSHDCRGLYLVPSIDGKDCDAVPLVSITAGKKILDIKKGHSVSFGLFNEANGSKIESHTGIWFSLKKAKL